MRFLNEYECSACGVTADAFVSGETIEDTKEVTLPCEECGRDTKHVKLLGGTKSRWHYCDPQR